MNEYIFRGFDVIGKRWVYGDLTHGKKVLKEEPYLEDRVMVGGYEVAPESVGLCTGEKDEEWNDVYEGDVVCFKLYGYKIYNQVKRFGRCFFFATEEGISSGFWANEYKVVGNMYENSELLKK